LNYMIYFVGNMLHLRNNPYTALPTITVNYNASCIPIKHFVNGNLTEFSLNELSLNSTVVRTRGYDLQTSILSGKDLSDRFTLMPSFVKVNDIRRSLSTDRRGYIWTLNFDSLMGNTPSVVCGQAPLTSQYQTCSHSTIIDGNFIQGYFILGNSKLLSASISASEMETELELLEGFGDISVSRIGPTSQNGYTWLITWLTAVGKQPIIPVSNSLTGANTVITIDRIQEGNYLSGFYKLQMEGVVSSLISVDASALVVKTALNNMKTVGLVDVSLSPLVTTEGGKSYLITFIDKKGDIPLLIPEIHNVSGVGATINVFEARKGSVANGTQLRLSFESQLYCSQSNVKVGICGSPVDNYEISVGPTVSVSDKTFPYTPDYNIQIVRIAVPSFYQKYNFSDVSSTGYFTLTYDGHVSAPISAEASETDMRDVIEAFPGVSTVRVSRTLSYELVSRNIETVPGALFITCSQSDINCGFFDLPPGELIYIENNWYKVADNYNGDKNKLPLALSTDASIYVSYEGTTSSNSKLYRWARGYEWKVTFMQTETDKVSRLKSNSDGLSPDGSLLSIRLKDCDECIIIGGLESWTSNSLKLSALNYYGKSEEAQLYGVPKSIPLPPKIEKIVPLSGTQLKVYFSPPESTGNLDITGYIIQWDDKSDFSNAVLGNCTTKGYGSCPRNSDSKSYEIENLITNTSYYVRVTARNSISLISTSLDPSVDSNNWSQTDKEIPFNQRPTEPISVETILSGKDSVQVIVTEPLYDGGIAITGYLFEWDSSDDFNSPNYRNQTVSMSALRMLQDNKYIWEISNLKTSQSYYVRVSAINSIGASPYRRTNKPEKVAGKPLLPVSVAVELPLTQNTPITAATVKWEPPDALIVNSDGGSSINGYVIELWEREAVPEIQEVEFVSANASNPFPYTTFRLCYTLSPTSGNCLSNINYDIDPINLRSGLMNLNFDGTSDSVIIGNLVVDREPIVGKGYKWRITFDTDNTDTRYIGNRVELIAIPSDGNVGKTDVTEVQPGSRIGGYSEVQYLEFSTSALNANVTGWFRVSFNGSDIKTHWLPVDVSINAFTTALGQLRSLRQVQISKKTITTGGSGYQYAITFTGDVGNLPGIQVESYLSSPSNSLQTIVYDGDNSVSSTNFKKSNAMPGEPPKGYRSFNVDKDLRSFVIQDLIPGTNYYISVSAKNDYGIGPRKDAPQYITPAIQVPQPPTGVSIAVNPGSTTNLKVAFDKPKSDGGSPITSYRVELDTFSEFYNPISQIINCPTNNDRSVFKISIKSDNQSDPITSGYFKLKVSGNKMTQITQEIPFDAVSMMKEEVGILMPVAILVSTTDKYKFTSASELTNTYFPGNRIKFKGQNNPDAIYTIKNVTALSGAVNSYFYVDQEVNLTNSVNSNLEVSRYYGGRGLDTQTSRVACTGSPSVCDPDTSGSMQSKFEMLTDIIRKGVTVDRDEPDSTNGITWRITFLDDSPAEPFNFEIDVDTNQITLLSGKIAPDFKPVLIRRGKVHSTCVGSHIVPDKSLNIGQEYYARVFAQNQLGYSLPQVSPTSQKPMVVPGAPTSVVLSVYSSTELRVVFNPPLDNGGDTIVKYIIEYSSSSSWAPNLVQETEFTNLAAGAPFFKRITGLTPGTFYFVRVRAKNSQGSGTAAMSTPSSLNPYQISDAPTNVKYFSTSNSMITVAFDYPINNGGDEVKAFRVEWDTSFNFNSVEGRPNKGQVDLTSPQTQKSYTITNLSPEKKYYVRVFAINSAGLSPSAPLAPQGVIPIINQPGKPHTITAITGNIPGQILLSWMPPSVPWHEIPCGGTPANPLPCPSEIGGGLPGSYGGSSITEYEISYNEFEDFTGYDKNSDQLSTTQTSFPLTGLTPGREYYIRVLARNIAGAGKYCSHTEQNCLIVSNVLKQKARI